MIDTDTDEEVAVQIHSIGQDDVQCPNRKALGHRWRVWSRDQDLVLRQALMNFPFLMMSCLKSFLQDCKKDNDGNHKRISYHFSKIGTMEIPLIVRSCDSLRWVCDVNEYFDD